MMRFGKYHRGHRPVNIVFFCPANDPSRGDHLPEQLIVVLAGAKNGDCLYLLHDADIVQWREAAFFDCHIGF